MRSWISTWPYGSLHCYLTSDSDDAVQALAPKYFNTRFLRVFVENVPFLVEKLGLKVLPCVICFVKGVSKDRHVQWLAVYGFSFDFASRIVGFEELGNADSFSTATLELRLLHTGLAFSCSQKALFLIYHTRRYPKRSPLCCQQCTCRGNPWNPPTPGSP